ncbi:unnamed protein product [Ilex paraguariensis]|uniref:Uncharacterized protein n=1 Tax=Ilex paraguariensis TaxID=185542 RepID=A0ABC8RP92_9AQUA
MPPRLNAFLFVFLILLIYSSSGMVEGFNDGVNPFYRSHKDGVQLNSRKLPVLEALLLDYDDAGANSKHDPRKGKPGVGGKNP